MTTAAAPVVAVTLRGEAGLYYADIPSAGLQLRFDHFREERGALSTEVTVQTVVPGGMPVYYDALRVNLLAGKRAKADFASLLTQATGLPDADTLVNKLFGEVKRRHRQGEQVVNLADIVPQPMRWRCWPLLPNGLPALFVAKGGTGKTTVSSVVAACVTSGMTIAGLRPVKGRVLYLDYESSADDMALLIHAIWRGVGIEGTPDIFYRPCHRQLVDEQEELRRACMEIKADLVIVDSVSRAAACEDENKSGPVSLYYNALSTFGWRDETGYHRPSTLSNSHTQKGEGSDKTARGSGNWEDQARSVWRLNHTLDGSTHEIGLFDTKRNLRRQMLPVGLRIDYVYGESAAEDTEKPLEAVLVSKSDVRDNPDLAAKLSGPDRVKAALRNGPISRQDIARESGVSQDAVDVVLSRGKKSGRFLQFLDGPNAGKFALVSTEE